MPPTLVLLDTNELLGAKMTAGEKEETKNVNENENQEDSQREFNFGGLQWKCGSCKGGPSQSCPICKPQLDIVQKKVFPTMNNGLPPGAGSVSDVLGGFASAFFEETPFLDSGGWMPGQNPVAIKSDMDLNMLT